MPRAAKACSDPYCPNPQPCPDHQRKPWAGSTRRHRLPKDWGARRQIVLDRGPVCTICGLLTSREVHHLGDSEDHRLEMLAGVCTDCHLKESSRQGNRAQGADVT